MRHYVVEGRGAEGGGLALGVVGVAGEGAGYYYGVLAFYFLYWLSLYLRVLFLLVVRFLWVVGGGYLDYRVHDHVEIWLLFSCL